jgi:arabinose-5-phosphate isomerase
MNYLTRAREVFDIEIGALKAVRAQLDESFEAAVDAVIHTLSSKGKVVVVGIGKSGNIGRKIAATLTSTGTTAVLLNSIDALHGDLGILNDGDLILALSYSGETEELLHLLPAFKRFSVRIVSFTAAPKSTLARYSEILLNVRVPKEACPFNLAPTSSTTAMLALGDALAMAILDARGFSRKQFAKHHPAGTIGRSLLLQVGEIMRRGERNPVADEKASVKEALFVMTRAKAGSLSVVNGKGKLVGVFTDGDLRRHMAADEKILFRRLSEVMTRNPICIRDSALASDALAIFNERNIDDLIVINPRKEPVGMIDLQDLPKLKLL